ncbi:hypothetical protein HS088_TW17G00066 [Tripterygium wilfordii]|uniref:FAS1 domain-containing protein n=1 Tax=Tripterygium wilfordii TaxID=458696 RepID=A0A7J7CEH4_TRIWF|nr:fasciclin-like arabinogalactan protein 14 [Tripterygium wilfordii]KAF5732539.1 hypothetical protein HS088_TW17G00066 [Tripterygium wilfordii]
MTTLKKQEASLIFFFTFFALFSNIYSFNITNTLSQYSDFSSFSDYLTKTQLVSEINSRKTITVLAVDNGNISPISGQPTDTMKKILSLHVILDYYDVQKLQKLSNKTAKLTTLFQASGQATDQLGFLNVTIMSGNTVAFGSAVKGSSLGSNLVKSVTSQPYNISILQVSSVIMPPGIGNSNSTSKSPPPPSQAPSDAPPSKAPTPSKAPSPKKSPPSEAPSPSDDADAPSDDANAPTADSPAGTPPAEADGPAADTPAAADGPAADADGKSAANAVGAKIGGLLSIFLFTFYAAVTMT